MVTVILSNVLFLFLSCLQLILGGYSYVVVGSFKDALISLWLEFFLPIIQ